MHSDKISVTHHGHAHYTVEIEDDDRGVEKYFCHESDLGEDLIDEIIHHHCMFVLDNYPSPVDSLACQMIESMNVHWLEEKSRTIGAVNIMETGFSRNQLGWLHEVCDRMDRADELEQEMEYIEMYGPQKDLTDYVGDSK